MEEPAVQVKDVSKSFKDLYAVKNLDFQVEKAECYGLLGPNGAGKTTMMKMLYGKALRDNPKESQINVLGYDPIHHELEIKYLSGIVPQENNLDIELSVIQNLIIYSKFYGLSRKTVLPRIEELLDFMELREKKYARIKELSGGMKRRLIIARALINSPRLLILDEPTTGLDPQVRHLIWDKLRQLKKEGVSILLTTHYMEEAFQLCDNLMIMHNGRKVLEGRPGILVKDHIEPYVLEVYDLRNRAKIKEGSIRVEQTDSHLLLYSGDLRLLKKLSDRLESGDHYLRQSNLEDVFLKITGRKLNE
jgi:lipooligosaccharide transport system ATP-binding protein